VFELAGNEGDRVGLAGFVQRGDDALPATIQNMSKPRSASSETSRCDAGRPASLVIRKPSLCPDPLQASQEPKDCVVRHSQTAPGSPVSDGDRAWRSACPVFCFFFRVVRVFRGSVFPRFALLSSTLGSSSELRISLVIRVPSFVIQLGSVASSLRWFTSRTSSRWRCCRRRATNAR